MRAILGLALGLAFAAGDAAVCRAEINIFAFDDRTIPFAQNLRLTMVPPVKHPGNPLLRPGPPGSPDAHSIAGYHTVLHENGKFRLWYIAGASGGFVVNRATDFRPAYAESTDGIHWERPALGLTEFRGSTRNNLLAFPPDIDFSVSEPLSALLIRDPDERDPGRRYKMAVYGRYFAPKGPDPEKAYPTIYPFVSPDGLRWKLSVPGPRNGRVFDESEAPFRVKDMFEVGGLYKFDGIYYVSGQERSPDIWTPEGGPLGRTMTTHWSPDFVHWTQEKSLSFMRYGYRSMTETLEEAHEPGGVWNRGNVLIGLYGLWHGSTDRTKRRLDMGFLVSNDGVHFREPVADYAFIKAGASHEWDRHGIVQGQAAINVGDETWVYYKSWDLATGGTIAPNSMGLVTLRRDGFGYLATRFPGEEGSFVTAPLGIDLRRAGLFLNVDGLGAGAFVRVEVLDRLGRDLAGHRVEVRTPGLRVPVPLAATSAVTPVRLRVRLLGKDSARIRFYAAYFE